MSGATKQVGFTIIETMLFLGITGLIMSFMLVGIGTQLNQRRYQDASTSLMTYVENQYNLVSNVNSSRTSSEVCIDNQITTTEIPQDNDAGRGTSDCSIVGRLLRSTDGGRAISSTPVIATVDAATLPLTVGDSDVKVLHDASLALGLEPEQYATKWGTSLVQPSPDNDKEATFSILLVRMPTSGAIRTYVSSSETISLSDLVDGTNAADFRLCLSPGGLLGFDNRPTGILMEAGASGPGQVDFISQGGC